MDFNKTYFECFINIFYKLLGFPGSGKYSTSSPSSRGKKANPEHKVTSRTKSQIKILLGLDFHEFKITNLVDKPLDFVCFKNILILFCLLQEHPNSVLFVSRTSYFCFVCFKNILILFCLFQEHPNSVLFVSRTS